MVQLSLTVLSTAAPHFSTFSYVSKVLYFSSVNTTHCGSALPSACVCVCVCHMVGPRLHGDVAAMETEVAGWGQAQWGAELRLTVTVTLERGE